jgi:hypothetical protein
LANLSRHLLPWPQTHRPAAAFSNVDQDESIACEVKMQKSRKLLIGFLLLIVPQTAMAGSLCQNHGCRIDSFGRCYCIVRTPPQVGSADERLAWIISNQELVNQ